MPEEVCKLCRGTKCLTQRGIVQVYLLSWRVALSAVLLGIVLGSCHSPYWFFLALAGYFLPLVNADLRLLLYPFVAVACAFGRKANCPECEPTGSIFRPAQGDA